MYSYSKNHLRKKSFLHSDCETECESVGRVLLSQQVHAGQVSNGKQRHMLAEQQVSDKHLIMQPLRDTGDPLHRPLVPLGAM